MPFFSLKNVKNTVIFPAGKPQLINISAKRNNFGDKNIY